MAKLYLVTGQPGVNIAGALEKVKAQIQTAGTSCQILKVDPEMIVEHLANYPEDPHKDLIASEVGLQYLLVYPKDYVRSLWVRALNHTLQRIEHSRDFILLSFHAISYHTKSREFFSTIDTSELDANLKIHDLRVEKIVTLIDDVYDVAQRLRAPGQIFDVGPIYRARKTLSNWLSTHQDLIRLFDWRAQEIMASEALSKAMGVPHFVIAIKHPVEVAYALIATDRIPIYLSHPISEIRRLSREGLTDFAKAAIDEIQSLTEKLLDSPYLVPFVPTSIDEFVVERRDGNYYPKLSERWPFRSDLALFTSPPEGSPKNPLDPLGALEELQKDKSASPTISAALELLTDWILAQISSRDRKLVEQCKAIVVFRPYYNGVDSKGVTAEIDHRNSLVSFKQAKQGERRCVVLASPDDMTKFRINRLVEEIGERCLLAGGDRLGNEVLNSVKDALRKDEIVKSFPTEQAAEVIEQLLEGEFGIVFKDVQNKFGALGGERQPMWRVETRMLWQELTREVLGHDPIKEMLQDGDVIRIDNLSIGEFVKIAEDTLR